MAKSAVAKRHMKDTSKDIVFVSPVSPLKYYGNLARYGRPYKLFRFVSTSSPSPDPPPAPRGPSPVTVQLITGFRLSSATPNEDAKKLGADAERRPPPHPHIRMIVRFSGRRKYKGSRTRREKSRERNLRIVSRALECLWAEID
jgi:hypothetical protein